MDLKTVEHLGYSNAKEIDGKFYGMYRFAFTVAVICDITQHQYDHRYCFDTWQNAELFYKDFDGKTPPVIGEDGCTAIK